MIATILSTILFVIFSFLGLIHFNWAFDGKWGSEKALPSKENGEKVLNPNKFATIIVGLILVVFGLIYLVKSEIINLEIPNWITNYGYWIIPNIFIIRAIGDFKYVGFFKKIKLTSNLIKIAHLYYLIYFVIIFTLYH